MDQMNTRRTDEQLECMLYDTAHWIVNGRQGVILSDVASLFCAVEHAMQFGAWGRHVQALVRADGPEVVVFSGQIRTLIEGLFPPDHLLVTLYAMKNP